MKDEELTEENLKNRITRIAMRHKTPYLKKLIAAEGKEYGWVRTKILNTNRALYEEDHYNLKRAFEEGWKLVRHSPYQELSEDLKELMKNVHISLKDGCFSTKDAVLCIRDKREDKEHEKYPYSGRIELNGDEIAIWGTRNEYGVEPFSYASEELLYSFKAGGLTKEMPEVDEIFNPILEKCDK